MFVLCSTGLPASARRAIEDAVDRLDDDVVYHGDLTDKTTHLVADRLSAMSDKVRCARRLRLPIVSPAWLIDSVKSGCRLLPPDKYFLEPLDDVNDENSSPQGRKSTADVCSFVREPLSLLRDAAISGDIAHPLSATGIISLCGRKYQLDTPTGFHKHAQLPLAWTAAVEAHTCTPDNGRASEQAGVPRAYTLRELLFALRCAHLTHADYFLACVRDSVEPVLFLDKRVLLTTALPRMSDASSRSSTTGCDDASRLLEEPLRPVTLAAIGDRSALQSDKGTEAAPGEQP